MKAIFITACGCSKFSNDELPDNPPLKYHIALTFPMRGIYGVEQSFFTGLVSKDQPVSERQRTFEFSKFSYIEGLKVAVYLEIKE